MHTKIFILVSMLITLSACTSKEVVAPVPNPDASGVSQTVNPVSTDVPTQVSETPPKDVHGAEVTGKAQDMPEGTKEAEHTSDPKEAQTVGDIAPNPESK